MDPRTREESLNAQYPLAEDPCTGTARHRLEHHQDLTLSDKVEYQQKKDQITHQTLGYPRFVKRENIDTETLFIIAQSKVQYV
jgi:hypothetical protein